MEKIAFDVDYRDVCIELETGKLGTLRRTELPVLGDLHRQFMRCRGLELEAFTVDHVSMGVKDSGWWVVAIREAIEDLTGRVQTRNWTPPKERYPTTEFQPFGDIQEFKEDDYPFDEIDVPTFLREHRKKQQREADWNAKPMEVPLHDMQELKKIMEEFGEKP